MQILVVYMYVMYASHQSEAHIKEAYLFDNEDEAEDKFTELAKYHTGNYSSSAWDKKYSADTSGNCVEAIYLATTPIFVAR